MNSNSNHKTPVNLKIAGIISAIRQQVAESILPHGGRLPTEEQLAKRFNVTPVTIKEVVRFLINYELLEMSTDNEIHICKGKDVVEEYFEKNRILLRDHLEVHYMLEMQIVRLAAHRRTQGDIRNLWFSLAKRGEYSINEDLSEFVKRDLELHEAIASASHNQVLQSAYYSLNNSFRKPYMGMFADNELFEPGLDAHTKVVEAVIYGDEVAAIKATKDLFSPLLSKISTLSARGLVKKTDPLVI
ncbi:putative L-lactate dehydrogenase operon regulatory protein [compost metagenome]